MNGYRAIEESARKVKEISTRAGSGRDRQRRREPNSQKYNVSRTTVTKGKKEYLAGEKYSSETGSRKPGGGRKCITEKKPEITTIIIEMIEKENGVYGDPMTERKWTTLSERKIARFLKEDHGITISSNTVGRILKKQIQPSAKQENEGNGQT